MAVAYIVISSGTGSRSRTTVWGAKSVSKYTGWNWRTCSRLIKDMESIFFDDGTPLLRFDHRNGDYIYRILTELDEVLISQNIVRSESAAIPLIMQNKELGNRQNCASVIVLMYIYKQYEEDKACCPDILLSPYKSNEDMNVGRVKGAIVDKHDYLNEATIMLPLISPKLANKALRHLYEQGMVRNIYIVIDDSVSFVAWATKAWHRGLYGDMQKMIRELADDFSYNGFNMDLDGAPVFWMNGDLVKSIAPAYLLMTTTVMETAETCRDNLEQEMEEIVEELEIA